MEQRTLVAIGGGGGFSDELLRDELMSLARSARPRVCFVPTASGDRDKDVVEFYRACTAVDCCPADLQLFSGRVRDLPSLSCARTSCSSVVVTTRTCSRSGASTVRTSCCSGLGGRAWCSAGPARLAQADRAMYQDKTRSTQPLLG
jgi:Peptidase family S51